MMALLHKSILERSLCRNQCQRILVWAETAKGFEDNVDLEGLLEEGNILWNKEEGGFCVAALIVGIRGR